MHIDKVGNGQNLMPVSMKHTMKNACIYITSNCIRKDLHSDKYIQCIKLLMYNIKGEGLPATDTDPNEECPPQEVICSSKAQCLYLCSLLLRYVYLVTVLAFTQSNNVYHFYVAKITCLFFWFDLSVLTIGRKYMSLNL